jgi:hypothetical protein
LENIFTGILINQGTEDWNGRNSLNQGIALSDFWQLGSTFDDNSQVRGIVSPYLKTINTDMYNAIEIKFGINNRFLDSVNAYFKIDNEWYGPTEIEWIEGDRAIGSQNKYRGLIGFTGQIQQVRIDFDQGTSSQDVRIFIDFVKFISEYNQLLQDDFNDNFIDLNKWIISGYTVYERNGLMDLRSEVTDSEGIAMTDWIEFDPNELLVFERDTLLHYANNYFIGKI